LSREERQVQTEEGKAWADKFSLLFLEGSAKIGENVEKAFHEIAQAVLEKVQKGDVDANFDVFFKNIFPCFLKGQGVRKSEKSFTDSIKQKRENLNSSCCS
jgi:Ras family